MIPKPHTAARADGLPGVHHRSRRDFVRAGVRGFFVVALATLGVHLVKQNATCLPVDSAGARGLCRGCRLRHDCSLPQAVGLRNQDS